MNLADTEIRITDQQLQELKEGDDMAHRTFLARQYGLVLPHTPGRPPAQPDFTVTNTGRSTSATQSFMTNSSHVGR